MVSKPYANEFKVSVFYCHCIATIVYGSDANSNRTDTRVICAIINVYDSM